MTVIYDASTDTTPTPTVDNTNEAAANFILDGRTADAKILGAAGQVIDRHGVQTDNLEQILGAAGQVIDRHGVQTDNLEQILSKVQGYVLGGAGWRDFADLEGLLSDATLTYTPALLETVVAGDIIRTRFEGFAYEVAAPDASDSHVATAGGVKLYVLPQNGAVHFNAFGADPTGDVESSSAINAAFAYAVANQVTIRSSGVYRCDYTISPGGRVIWDSGDTTLEFGNAIKDNLTEIQKTVLGSAVYSGSGKYALLDTSGMVFSVHSGRILVNGVSVGGTFNAAARDLVPDNFVAFSAATENSADIIWDRIEAQGVHHMFYQGDMRGTAQTILPYTRWNVSQLRCQFVKSPWQSGQSGNGFDDMVLQNVRITRCAGVTYINGSDHNALSFFCIGLKTGDYEPQTITVSAGSTAAVMSADNSNVVAGTVLAFKTGRTNKGGRDVGFVADVISKSDNGDGTFNVVLSAAPTVDLTNASFWIDPPSLRLTNANGNFLHFYIEEAWDLAVELGVESTFIAQDFKVSGGAFTARYGAPITITGRYGVDVDIQSLHDRAQNNPSVERLVAVGSQRNGAEYSEAKVTVRSGRSRNRFNVKSDLIEIVALRSDDLEAGYINAESDDNPLLNLTEIWLEGALQVTPYAGGGYLPATVAPYYRPLNFELVADFDAATGAGNTTVAGAGASRLATKAPGATGRLDFITSFAAGDIYRLSYKSQNFVAGSPRLRFQNGTSTVVGSEVTIFRSNRRDYFYITCPAGAVDRLSLFSFAADDYEISDFKIERLSS